MRHAGEFVGTTDNEPKNEPELRGLVRRLLCGLCLATALGSAFPAAGNILLTGQILNDEIRGGIVESVVRHTKSGPRLRLDTGEEVVFSNIALYRRPTPIVLAVGDRIEKHRDSCVYIVNGRGITDVSWLVHEVLVPWPLLIPIGAYVLLGTAFVLSYRRTPLGECIWSNTDPNRPRRPTTRAALLVLLGVNWLILLIVMVIGFGCISGCLSGIGKLVSG